nr:L-type lectin-domain containing receptor kinase I.9 [Aegilops tauschii subsp. strangulata]
MGDEILLERILNGDEEPKDLPLGLLQLITNDFSQDRKIGQGGFGEVYKGVLRKGIIVSVKRMYVNLHRLRDDDKLFDREFNSLRKVNHRNVVRFLGFCSNTYQTSIQEAGSEGINLANVRERLLCFEYISNGSLDKHITDELRGLEWETRYDIIIGICKGLRYLHKEKNIVHMDLKPANILLDGTYMVPKITDFGLSRSNKNSHTTGLRFGTRGYVAPEYENAGKISSKSDVYSLGVIIFELLTGSMGVPDENNVLRRWRHRWNKPPTLLQYQQVTRCIKTAVHCRQQEPGCRPSVSEIISFLSESTNEHTDGISPLYDEDDMLGIKPLELGLPSERKEMSSFTVELTNGTANCMAFNIQPPNTPRYSAQPDKGIVRPQSMYRVKITVLPQDIHHADKFIVKSMKVSEGLRDEDITERMFEEAGKIVDEVNLMVVYEPTKPQQNCKSIADTNMPAEEVPEAERRNIVGSTSRKGKLRSGGNAEAASTGINSRVQGQCNFYPPQSSSHNSLGYLTIPLLDRVAANAGDALVAELLRACGLGKVRRKLECHLAAIQCILLDADAKSRTNAAVHRWMTDLKTAAYQTDDVLDDFHYEALRRHAAQIGHVSTAHKLLSYFTINSPVVFRLSMSMKMKDALKVIDELVLEMNNFHFLQHAEARSVDHPQTHSRVDESVIVGRQDEKELVVNILLDHSHDNNNNDNVIVLPIVGMG